MEWDTLYFDIISLPQSPHEVVAHIDVLTPRKVQRVLDKSDRLLVVLQKSDLTLHLWGYERYDVLCKHDLLHSIT